MKSRNGKTTTHSLYYNQGMKLILDSTFCRNKTDILTTNLYRILSYEKLPIKRAILWLKLCFKYLNCRDRRLIIVAMTDWIREDNLNQQSNK